MCVLVVLTLLLLDGEQNMITSTTSCTIRLSDLLEVVKDLDPKTVLLNVDYGGVYISDELIEAPHLGDIATAKEELNANINRPG